MGLLKFLERLRVVDQFGRCLDGRGLGARFHHGLQGALLKVGLAFDDVDQVGNQVGPALVLAQHFGPTGLDLFVPPLELVVAAARKDECGADQKEGKPALKSGGHGVPRVGGCSARVWRDGPAYCALHHIQQGSAKAVGCAFALLFLSNMYL